MRNEQVTRGEREKKIEKEGKENDKRKLNEKGGRKEFHFQVN